MILNYSSNNDEPLNLSSHKDDEDLLTIGAVAQAAGVTVRTVRYYEEMDLIGPVRRSSGKYRLYNRRILKRINAILALQALGYSLEEILVTLGPYAASQTFSKEERIVFSRQSLVKQRECIQEKLEKLERMKADVEGRIAILDSVCQPCNQQSPGTCEDSCQHRDAHITG
jgi:DNA-binding transcriptional MerR regulator